MVCIEVVVLVIAWVGACFGLDVSCVRGHVTSGMMDRGLGMLHPLSLFFSPRQWSNIEGSHQ